MFNCFGFIGLVVSENNRFIIVKLSVMKLRMVRMVSKIGCLGEIGCIFMGE